MLETNALSPKQSSCLYQLSATQRPPALLQMLHERARWFHEYPTQSQVLMSLEQQALMKKSG